MKERPLPHSLEAEKAVLADVFLDPDRLGEARTVISHSQFFDRRNALIFKAICAVADGGAVPDMVTVKEWLASEGALRAAGNSAYVASVLDSAVRSRNVMYHAAIVAEKARRRNILIRLEGIQEAACDGTTARDFDELIEGLSLERNARTAVIEPLSAIDLSTDPGPPPEPLVGNDTMQLIMPREITALASDPGVGKTKLLTDVMLAVASGRECLGMRVAQGPVIYVTSDGDPDLQRNIRRQWTGREQTLDGLVDLPVHVHAEPGFCLEAPGAFESLRATLDFCREKYDQTPRLLVVETLATNVSTTDLNSQTDVRKFVNQFLRPCLAACPEMAVIISCHLKKKQTGGANDLGSRVAGSVQIKGAVDCVIGLLGSADNSFTVKRIKRSRSGGDFQSFAVKIVGDRTGPLSLSYQGFAATTDEDRKGAEKAVLEYLSQHPGKQALTWITKALGTWKPRAFKPRAVQNAARNLAEDGEIVRTGEKPASYELIALAVEDPPEGFEDVE